MINVILLVFSPHLAWERIATARRGIAFILLMYLAPLLGLICVSEGYGLVLWGRSRPFLSHPYQFPVGEAVLFESAHFLLLLAAVLAAAYLLQSLGSTFHGRHTFAQAFTTVAYGMGPLFLLRLSNMFPIMPVWPIWALGLFLSVRALYPGLPRIMEPDPPTAFGLFLLGVGFLAAIMGIVRYLSLSYMQGKLNKLEALFLAWSGHGG